MRNLLRHKLRIILLFAFVLGLMTTGFAQTKSTTKKRTTRRAAPLVPVGTDLKVRINDTLSSKDSRVGDRFTATVIDPSRFDEAKIYGRISSIEKSGKVKGRTSMNLAFDRVELRDVIERAAALSTGPLITLSDLAAITFAGLATTGSLPAPAADRGEPLAVDVRPDYRPRSRPPRSRRRRG
jgi:hypothetical protein